MALEYKKLKGFSINAMDGKAGKLKDILFDDHSYKVRYFVIDTSSWLPGRKILLSPEAVDKVDYDNSVIFFKLTKDTIENSPPLSDHLPVSKQHEQSLTQYYSWAPYAISTGWFPYPAYTIPNDSVGYASDLYPSNWINLSENKERNFDRYLRSCEEICGYKISSIDEEKFGEVSNIIFIEKSWLLIDLVLSSNRWLPGGKNFACSPMFVESFNEYERELRVSMTKKMMLDSPEYKFENYGEQYRESLLNHYLVSDENVDLKAKHPKHFKNKDSNNTHRFL